MTIHLRQSNSQGGIPHHHHHLHNNDKSSANHNDPYRKSLVIVMSIMLVIITFASMQYQDASKAQEIEQDNNNKLKFETIGVVVVNNDEHTNNNNIDVVVAPTTPTTDATTPNNTDDKDDNKDPSTTSTVTTDVTNEEETKTQTQTKTTNNDETSCTLDCTNLKQQRIDQFSGDLSSRSTMLELATKAREEMIASIRQHYGSYFDDIFLQKNIGFQPIQPESAKRLQRKLQIKALQVQWKFAKEPAVCEKDCELLINPNPNPIFESQYPYYLERYVWATGGHSAAAGHGNLFNESYTAFLERDVQPLFAAIGMEFEGRNYAMGGTRSGLEIAMCFEQVFGSDVDFFSWDYGMTDGRKDSLLFHYGYRGALTPNRPAMLGVWTNGWKGRDERLRDLANIGMATFHRPSSSIDAMNAAFPDSGDLTEAQLDELPDFVRNFKCQGQIEKGDPHCRDDKYSKGICDERASKVNWHPGIKQHGVDGHMLAMFLSDSLIKALQGLVDHSNQDAESLLQELQKEEDELMDQIQKAKLEDFNAWKIYDKADDLKSEGIDLELLYKGKSICHTGRLPAMTRYLGYLTDTDKVAGIAPYMSEQYDTGIQKTVADETNANGQMQLVWEYNAKDRQTCEVPLRPDYKDFFYSNHKDGIVKLNFPNDKERAAYKYNQSEMKGVIVFVLNECDWGKCKAGDLKLEDIEKGDVKIKINGVDVTKLINVGSGCLILKHKDGIQWEPSRKDDYEIAVEVMVPNSYLRISSIVIY